MGNEGLANAGGNLRKAKAKKKSEISVNPNARINAIEMEPNRKFVCSCCGKEYNTQKGNFPVSNSILYKGNNGYITVCRSCVDKYYLQLIGFYNGDDEQALEHCCSVFDWYYAPEISEITKKTMKGTSRVILYPSKMGLITFQRKGTTYLDTLRQKYAEKAITEETITESRETNNSEKLQGIEQKTIDFFGANYTPDEYRFLEKEYNDWTSRYPCDTKAKEEIFKNLAIAQVVVRRAQKEGSSKTINEAMRTFQDLLGTANIKPNQDKEVISDQDTFGTWIKKLENQHPIPEARGEWKDPDGVKKMVDTFFMGHLSNVLHVNNDMAEAYKEEMEKYTVKPPKYDDMDDNSSDTSLLDKYAEKVTDD